METEELENTIKTEENAFRQLRLNQWVKQAVRWMPMDKWDACAFPANEDDLEGRVCYGGLDLSSTTDITAFVLVFPPLDEDDKFAILPYFWIPEDTLELRVRRDHVPYDVWERQGFLQTTEGNVVHYGYVEKFIERLGERFNIREIAFDRWGAVQMVQNLEGMGFTVVPFGQGFKDMSPPTKELMKLTLEKKLAHCWPPHKSKEESLDVIKNVFTGAECYAICEKGAGKAIGAIELKLNGHTDMTERDDECELGYWLGKPFWGRGFVPEVAREILRHGFEDIGMTTIWCGYYDGNVKSKRVQEKVGFIYHHTCEEVPVPLMNEIRVGHTNYMTKEHWEECKK